MTIPPFKPHYLRLPSHLDFYSLNACTNRHASQASPAILQALEQTGPLEFEAGELDALLIEIDAMRQMDLRNHGRGIWTHASRAESWGSSGPTVSAGFVAPSNNQDHAKHCKKRPHQPKLLSYEIYYLDGKPAEQPKC